MTTVPVPDLARLQAAFVAAVLHREPGVEPWLAPGRVAPARGLAVYRANARANFANALAAAFPALRASLGDEEWNSLAWSCQRACPSRHGDLFRAGERLVAFLAAQVPGTPREALHDLARLEWAIQQVMVAADAPVRLDLTALARVAADRHGDLRFQLVPACEVLRVRAGTAAYWEAWRDPARGLPGGVASGPPLPPDPGACEELLVQRRDAGLQVIALAPGEFALLAALAAGASLGDALAEALAVAPDLDPGAALAAAARRGLLAGFTTPP